MNNKYKSAILIPVDILLEAEAFAFAIAMYNFRKALIINSAPLGIELELSAVHF